MSDMETAALDTLRDVLRGYAALRPRWYAVESDAEVDDLLAQEAALVERGQEAFWHLTKAVNTRDKCALVDITEIKRYYEYRRPSGIRTE